MFDTNNSKVPSSEEKDVLFIAGLETRKIRFEIDKETDVIWRILHHTWF